MEQKSGLEFSGDGTAGYMHSTAGYMVEKVKIVSVHVRYFSFFSFFQFLQFTSVRLRQVTSGYGGVIFHMFSATHQNASGVRGDTGVRETGVLG